MYHDLLIETTTERGDQTLQACKLWQRVKKLSLFNPAFTTTKEHSLCLYYFIMLLYTNNTDQVVLSPPLQSSNLPSMYPASHPVSAGICPVSLELDEDNVIVQIYLLDAY